MLIKICAWLLALGVALLGGYLYLDRVGFDGGYTTQFQRGQEAEAAGDYEKAFSHYIKAAEILPLNASAHIKAARMLLVLGQNERAIELLSEFMQTQPSSYAAYDAMIEIYEQVGAAPELILETLRAAASLFKSPVYADRAAALEKEIQTVYAPELSLAAGEYEGYHTVSVTNVPEGGEVFYTADGSAPDKTSAPYKAGQEILLSLGTTTLKFISYNKYGYASPVSSFTYIIRTTEEDDTPAALMTAFFGNNSFNGGYAAAYDQYVFYVSSEGRKLFRMRRNGAEKTLLSEDECCYLNVYNNRVYYVNLADENRVYSVDFSGENKRLEVSDPVVLMQIAGGRIYYTTRDGGRLYSKNISSGIRTQLTGDRIIQFNIYEGYIYYKNETENEALYRVAYDGTEKTRVLDDRAYNINISDGRIYYISVNDERRVYTAALDGSGRRLLLATSVTEILAFDGSLYYRAEDGGNLYKLKIAGSELVRLSKSDCSNLSVALDYIYYIDNTQDKALYRVDSAGNGTEKID